MTDDDRPDDSDDDDSRNDVVAPCPSDGRKKRLKTSARRELIDLIVGQAVGASLMRRLKTLTGRPLVVSVKAPGADWCKPLVGAFLRTNAMAILRDGSTKGDNAEKGNDVVSEALSEGKHVVGVSHLPEALLPATLTRAADARVEAKHPDGKIIRRLISMCVGRPPKNIPEDIVAGLSFDDIVSAFRRGATPSQVVAALAAASSAKCRVSVEDSTPPLDRMPGYARELREWAFALAEDVDAWRRHEREWRSISSSVVLAGPPGTGKSLFARSLAATLKVPMIATSVAQWFGTTAGYLDSVIKAADAAFEGARAAARNGGTGCLLLLDELDAIPNRNNVDDRHAAWWTTLTTGLLLRLDSATSDREGVILVGATNHVENLDPALIRPGRFDKIQVVGFPDSVGLAEIISFHMDGAMSPADVLPLARTQAGSTGAEAAQWAKDALRRARTAGRNVCFDDLVAAITSGAEMSPGDRRVTAIHEAGHAVVGVVVGRRIEAVSILSKGSTAGATSMRRAGSCFLPMDDIEKEVTVLLAGRAAEMVVLGRASGSAESDIREATSLVAAAHGSFGLGDDLLYRGSREKATELITFDPAFRRLVSEHLGRLMDATLDIVRRDRAAVEAIADALVERGYVEGDDAERIVKGAAPIIEKGDTR
ncbi:hypothetical protein M2323_000344 [Rhodoblastus acidophilus]|uniref:AAA family ATPase n=1 Tax=Rhodoblastus acidophilus TaxID=1074 RepID=UPI002223F983|nr:AAA family ATPase [Rhodoblastus acidophilus]MCW2282583.1 hypothetical protein [Rhodoblastus acidophilus]MCW2331444.1 hypothetical protein [Rhodoblastus acidophilus]